MNNFSTAKLNNVVPSFMSEPEEERSPKLYVRIPSKILVLSFITEPREIVQSRRRHCLDTHPVL